MPTVTTRLVSWIRLNRSAVAVALIVVVIRVAALWAQHDQLSLDPDSYRALSENLARFRVLGENTEATAYRPSLYPILLSVAGTLPRVTPLGVALLHLALGLATIRIVWRLATRHLGPNGQHAAILAALFVALDPILLYQSAQVMTETLATYLAMLCLNHLTRLNRNPSLRRAIVAGAALGLAALCRPTFLAWFPLIVIVLALQLGNWRPWLRVAVPLTISMALVQLPWVIRNQQHLGHPVLATTHGGYTLLLGNNPAFYDNLRNAPAGSVWDAEASAQRWLPKLPPRTPANEWEQDRILYDQARHNIRQQPGMFAYSCLVRLGRFWGLVPHQIQSDESPLRRTARYATGLWYLVLSLLAIWGAFRLRRQWLKAPWVWGLTLALSFTAVHALYWSNLRMRAPLVPVVALFAATAATTIGGHRLNP
jgi:hypothetical protein